MFLLGECSSWQLIFVLLAVQQWIPLTLDQSFLQFLKWMIHQCHARIAIFLWTAFFTSLLMTGFNIEKRFPQGSEKFAFSKVSYMQTNNIFSVRSVARMYFSFQISEHLLGIQLELSRNDSGMRHLGLW